MRPRLVGRPRRGTMGKDMLAAPLVHYAFALDWTIVIGIVGLAYGLGLWSAARAGHPHPRAQVVAFYASLAVLLVSFLTPVDAYDNVSFFDHMAQHLLLAFVAAPLFALGGPISLALKATPPRWRSRWLAPVVDSKGFEAITHPVTAAASFFLVQAGILVRPLFNDAVNTGLPHFTQHALLMATSFLVWRSMAGVDPPRHRVRFPLRPTLTVVLLAVVSAVALFVLVADVPLYRYATFPPPWGGHAALLSQRRGAWLLLAGGDCLVLAAAFLVHRATLRVRVVTGEA